MKNKWTTIILVMLLLICGSASFLYLYLNKSRVVQAEYVSSQVNHVRLLIETLEAQVSATYRTRLQSFLQRQAIERDEAIVVAFKERKREELLQFCLPFMETFRRENPSFHSFSWILPNNELFLAVQQPGEAPHLLAAVRTDVMAANEKMQQVAGYSYCHELLQYSVVSPVMYHGEHLGAVQFGLSVDFILRALNEKMNLPATLVIPRDQLQNQQLSIDGYLSAGGYVLQSTSTELFTAIKDQVSWQADQQHLTLGNQDVVLVKALSLNDYRGLPLAQLFVAIDVTAQQNAASSDVIMIVIVTVMGVLLIFVLLYFSFANLVGLAEQARQPLENAGPVSPEQEHNTGHKRYHAIFNATHAVMLLVNPSDGSIVDANRAAINYFGYSKEQLQEMKISDINTLSQGEIARDLLRARDNKKNVFRFKHRLADGQVRDVEVFSGPIKVDGTTLLFSIIHDVTVQQRLERQLWQARQMDAMGTMAGAIAHDFNNQLTSIIGNADLGLQQFGPDSPAHSYFAQILASSQNAAEMVKQVLAFSAPAGEASKPVDLAELLRTILAMLRASFPATVTIELDSQCTCPPVLAEQAHLLQMVRNLCARAVESMVEGRGQITIRLAHQQLTGSEFTDLAGLPEGAFVVLSVSDNGVGLDGLSEERAYVPAGQKLGMDKDSEWGLVEAHTIVQGYGGFMRVRSLPEQGTCYRVFLPCQVVVKEEIPALPVSDDEVRGGEEHLLIVDDEGTILLLLEAIFSRLGYQVTTFSDGLKAYDFLQGKAGSVDLLITDQSMPGLTGVELAEQALALDPDLPIILCTGYSPDVLEEGAKAKGISRYVQKPINRQEIARAVRELLD